MDTEPLRIRLLGAVDLRIGEMSVAPLDSARAESLLALLVLHRDAPQPRQRVAFVLWPESTERQAHTNLRKLLHKLRRALPDADRFIEVGPRTLRWRPEVPLWLDVEHFERAVAEARLDEAVDTYGGELLEGHYDEWIFDERERLGHLYLETLERLTRQHARAQRWPDAIRCAERLLAQDRLREENHRLLMQVCRASGDRARAVRAYHVCASTLARELGIEPSAETRAIYASLIAVAGEADDARAPDPASISASASSIAPFVGRADERAKLGTAWNLAVSGQVHLVLVTGEPGVGKTRLVEELAAHTGAVAASARAYPAEGPLAYGIVAAWLRSDPVAARLPRLERPYLTELARLVPELALRVPSPEPVPEPELRQRLFAAITRAVLAVPSPLLLIVDDAQWADAESLAAIHYLLRAAPSARLLLAITARREELHAGHPLLDVITAMQPLQHCIEIELARFDRADTARLATTISGAALDADQLDRLYTESEGNPLFIVEALKPDAPSTAPRVQAVIAGRLARLSPPAALLAGSAAAIGRAFTADVLAAASGLDQRAFVSALDELWQRGIVRAQDPNGYDFSHARIRDAAYAALSPPGRRQAHRAIARALEQDQNVVAAAVARHYEQAGAVADAVRWYARAAEAAQWLYAHSDAIRSLEHALELAGALPAGPVTAQQQLRLLTALPAPLLAVDGYGSERIDGVHMRAERLATQLGVEPDPPLVWSMALAALSRGDWPSARGFGAQLRARAERDGDEVLRVESDYIRGIAAYWPGQLVLARNHFTAALRRFAPVRRRDHILRYGQDPELLVRLRLAHALWLMGQPGMAERQRDSAVGAAAESTHVYSRAVTWIWAAILALDRGEVAEFCRHAAALDADVSDDAPAQVALAAELFAGHRDVLEGRTAAGLARVRKVRDLVTCGPAPAPGLPGVATRVLLADYALAGSADDGLALADEALRMGRGAQLWAAEISRLRATFLARLDAPRATVAAELDRALALARQQQARAFEDRIQATLRERNLGHGGAVDHRTEEHR